MNNPKTKFTDQTGGLPFRLPIVACLLLGLLCAVPRAAHATSINYGDFPGVNVMYLGVTESSITDTPPLYGAPQLVGDSLVFQPNGFGSSSSDLDSDITDGQLTMTLMSQANGGIASILIQEAGDYVLAGPVDQFAMALVGIPIHMRVIEIDGLPVPGIMPVLHTSVPVTLSGGVYTLDDEGAGSGNWTAELLVDINNLVAQTGYQGHATKVLFSMDNQLATASVLGTSAEIFKKDVAFVLTANDPVPEPATLVLLGLGLVGLSWTAARRRRDRHS